MQPIKRSGSITLPLLLALLVLVLAPTIAGAQTPDEELVKLGESLFVENCAVCHGLDGQGRVGATLSKDWPSIRPDLAIKNDIVNGVPGSPMPAWSQANGGPLSPQEIDALVAYILTWQTGGPLSLPPTPTPRPRPALTSIPDVEGDPNNGSILFDQNCVVCHGADGRGRVGSNLSNVFSAIRPDLGLQSTIANGLSGSPMPAWSQANGGPLTQSEINDLVAFILTLPDTSPQAASPTPTPVPSAFFSGWGGVIFGIVLFAIVVAVAIYLQTRRS